MAIKYVLFDLDGTLLPMDQHKFSKKYFALITAKFAPLGYDPTAIVNSIQSGIVSMVKNDGALLNEEICWRDLVKGLGEKVLEDKKTFDEFYRNDFDMIKDTCGYNEISAAPDRHWSSSGLRRGCHRQFDAGWKADTGHPFRCGGN